MAAQETWIRNTDGTYPWDAGNCPNSCKITYPAGASLADLMDTFQSFLTAHGWELWDAAAGTNKRAFRALAADGVTWKYVVLDAGTTAGRLALLVYELWNNTSHVGTTLVANSNQTGFMQYIDLAGGGAMYLFAHPRWLVACSHVAAGIGNYPSANYAYKSATFVLEYQREAPEDTPAAGYPCTVFTSGNAMLGRNDGTQVPRSPASTQAAWVVTDMGGGSGATAQVPKLVSAWSSKFHILNIYVGVGVAASAMAARLGKLYGVKALIAGAFMDECMVKCDGDYFMSPSGVAVPHNILIEDSSVASRIAIPK